MNLNTLESRLSSLIKRAPVNNHNQRPGQLVNPSSSIGTMIPTPGMSHSGNSNLMVSSADTVMTASSGCDSISVTTMNMGSLLPSSSLHSSFSRSDGISELYNFNYQCTLVYSIQTSQKLWLQGLCLMDISKHWPISLLALVGICHPWVGKE